MAKYDEKFKISVVQEYLAGNGVYKTLAAKYGIRHSQVERWVNSYRQSGENGLIKKFSHYNAQFKLRVLEHMWREELSFNQTIHLFDLRGGGGVSQVGSASTMRAVLQH